MIKRKKNPKDQKLLNQIEIEKEYKYDSFNKKQYIIYQIWLNDDIIGYAEYFIGKNYVFYVYINPIYRKSGLATYLYDYIEQDQSIKLESNASTKEGKAFWLNRLKTRKNPH